jgi:HD-like signal output (HDOD) protein
VLEHNVMSLVDSGTSARCRASTCGASGEDPKGVTVSPDLGDAASRYSGYVGVFNKLFKKGQPEATPVSVAQAGPVKAAAGTVKAAAGPVATPVGPATETLTMTSMLEAQIALLGDSVEPLESDSWVDIADRVAALAVDLPPMPAFPMVATRLISMARDPDLDMNKLSTEVQRDAGIASTLIRVVNSAAFSPESPITTLRSAIQMLGLKQVVEIVVGCSGQALYEVQAKADLALFPDLWQSMFSEAMGNAFVAGRIALDVPGASSEKALLAGLLVDVGRPLGLRVLCKMIREGMERPEEAIVMAILEEVAPDIGARAVSAMGLPAELASACTPDRQAPAVEPAIAKLVSAVGAVQRSSPRIWANADEVRHWAEAIKLSPVLVHGMFSQRETYVAHAAAMFDR